MNYYLLMIITPYHYSIIGDYTDDQQHSYHYWYNVGPPSYKLVYKPH